MKSCMLLVIKPLILTGSEAYSYWSSAAEVYMPTDNSADFRDTWAFVRLPSEGCWRRLFKRYLAEAVGAGIGSTVQGFKKGMSQEVTTPEQWDVATRKSSDHCQS